MKKYIFLPTFFFSFSLSAQDLYWYDVLLDVNLGNAKEFEKAVDDFYSSVDPFYNINTPEDLKNANHLFTKGQK